MSNNRLESFPILSKNDKNKLNNYLLKVKIIPKSTIDGVEKEIKEEESDFGVKILSSEDTNWTCSNNNLKFTIELNLNEPQKLYDEFDLALPNSKIAIGLMISCKNSNFCEYYDILDLPYNSYSCNTIKNINFNKMNLRREVKLNFFLYLKNIENVEDNRHANKIGTNLGEILEIKYMIEGSSSEFNIQEVNVADKPLWYFDIDINDLNQDLYDNCKIFVNMDNKLYDKFDLKETKETKVRVIWIEIYTRFIYEILLAAYQADFDYQEQYDSNSVGNFVKFYTEILDISKEDLNNTLELYDKLKVYIQNKLFS